MSTQQEIEQDLWDWIHNFVVVPNAFYQHKFAPCPYARAALMEETVDVAAWQSGDARAFIREKSIEMRDTPKLTTRVMAFPPRMQWAWGISEYVETLNATLIPDNVFLNTGVAKTTVSRYAGSSGAPYFIVVANSLDAVLKGAQSLKRSAYYKDWPPEHVEIVVERRARLARRYQKQG